MINQTSESNTPSLYLLATGEGAAGVPTDFTYSVGFVLNRYASTKVVVLFSTDRRNSESKMAFNSYDGKWAGWKVL